MPGGIGTALEAFMVWQLLQVKHIKEHPVILVGGMWFGLIEWMKESMLSRGLVSEPDMHVVTVVRSGAEAMPIISEAFERFKKEKANGNQPGSGLRRA